MRLTSQTLTLSFTVADQWTSKRKSNEYTGNPLSLNILSPMTFIRSKFRFISQVSISQTTCQIPSRIQSLFQLTLNWITSKQFLDVNSNNSHAGFYHTSCLSVNGVNRRVWKIIEKTPLEFFSRERHSFFLYYQNRLHLMATKNILKSNDFLENDNFFLYRNRDSFLFI